MSDIEILNSIKGILAEENNQEFIALLNFLTQIQSDTSSIEGVIDIVSRNTSILRNSMVQALISGLEANPEDYQAYIFLSFVFFEFKGFKRSYEFAQKAHQLLNDKGLYRSPWINVAMQLTQIAMPHMDAYPEFLDDFDTLLNDLKKVIAEKEGKTLKCDKCGNFNPDNSKFCLICGQKMSKKKSKK